MAHGAQHHTVNGAWTIIHEDKNELDSPPQVVQKNKFQMD